MAIDESSSIQAELDCPSLGDCAREVGVCSWIFGQMRVWPLITGGTRVEWTMHPSFNDSGPYSYQLQTGRTGNNSADDWVNVGLPVTNGCFAVDPEQRVYGKTQWTHYRVVLTTANDIYVSDPQPATGALDKESRLLVKEIERKELLRLKKAAGQEGVLLKRRLFGMPCDCRDYMTEEATNSDCPECLGTGFVGGYFEPVEYWAELTTHGHDSKQSPEGRGTVDDATRVRLRGLNSPQVFSYDVWVAKHNDYRWILRQIGNVVEVRGVPVVISAEARLAPFSHPVYKIEV